MRAMRYVVLSSLLAAVGCGGMEQSQDEQQVQDSVDVQPAGKGGGLASEFAKPTGQAGSGDTNYHGGPVMPGTKNIYYIWYGNWAGNTATTDPHRLGQRTSVARRTSTSTPPTTTARSTRDELGARTAASTTMTTRNGTALTDANIQTIVSDAIAAASCPRTPTRCTSC